MENKSLVLCVDFNKYHIKVGEILEKYGLKLVVSSTINTLIEYLYKNEGGVVFIDGPYRKYYYFLKALYTDFPSLNKFCFIFLDNKTIDYKSNQKTPHVFMIDCRANLNEHINYIIKKSGVLIKMKNPYNESDAKKKINNMLVQLGFSPKYTGFNYISDGLFHIVSNGFKTKNFNKEIYEYLCQTYNVNMCNVERNIKSAATNAVKDNEMFFDMFNQLNKKITNRTVLSFLVEHLITTMGSDIATFNKEIK